MEPRYRRLTRDLVAIVVVGLPICAALLGLLGGSAASTVTARSPQAELSVTAPETLRSGNWFEVEMKVQSRVPVNDLTISVDRGLWRRLSIDTIVPDAESAESADGRYRYHFGPARPGQSFVLKLDGQIQPDGLRRLEGKVVASDGDRPLAALPLDITVLP